MPAVTLTVTVSRKTVSALQLNIDSNQNGAFDEAETVAVLASGPDQYSQSVVVEVVSGTSFVLNVEGDKNAEVDCVCTDESGQVVYETTQPVKVPKGGKTWLAGRLS